MQLRVSHQLLTVRTLSSFNASPNGLPQLVLSLGGLLSHVCFMGMERRLGKHQFVELYAFHSRIGLQWLYAFS